MKKKIKTICIITKIQPYSDSSQIINAICRDLGQISILAKGIRKSQAKNPLVPVFEYELNLYAPLEQGLYLLADASLIRENPSYINPQNWAAAEAGTELLWQIAYPPEEATIYYDLLHVYLDYLQKPDLPAAVIWWRFFRRVLAISGIGFEPHSCNVCGAEITTSLALDRSTGNIVCNDCRAKHHQSPDLLVPGPLATRILLLLPEIGHHVHNIKLYRSLVREINEFFLAYFASRFHKDLRIKSLSVLEQFYPE